MKRIPLLAILLCLTVSLSAQERTEANSQVINIGDNGENSISAEDGGLSLMLNGYEFLIRGNKQSSSKPSSKSAYTTRSRRVHFGIAGINAPNYNHLAAVELGGNYLVGTDYVGYSDEEANLIGFINHKSICLTTNIFTLNASITRNRLLTFDLGFGITAENYSLRNDVTLEYAGGKLQPVALDPTTKKSKLRTTYMHIPAIFNLNIARNFFVGVGVNFDVLLYSELKYKKPKHTIEGTMPLNPIQVGITGRIGWKRLYAFVNYSPMNFYKSEVNIKGHRLSAGAGIWF